MSVKLDILTSGYATLVDANTSPSGDGHTKRGDKFMRATGSSCLIRSSKTNILFDTMGPWERDLLVSRLANLKIHPDDIEYLICSHSHPDHIGNLNLFTKAKKHFVGTSVYTGDIYDLNCFEPIGSYSYKSTKRDTETTEVVKYQNYQIDANSTIEPTPGHTMECITLTVSNCESYGTVALAGDLFENENDVEDESIWLGAGSQNPDLQRAHRSSIYKKVDFVLPGHGPLFKTQEHTEF